MNSHYTHWVNVPLPPVWAISLVCTIKPLELCQHLRKHQPSISITDIFFQQLIEAHNLILRCDDSKLYIYRVYKTYKHLLMIWSDYPLSPIYSTKNLAKKVSRDQEQGDKVSFVGPGNKTAILGKITVKLRSFREWYWKLLDEVKGMQENLFGGIGFNNEEWMSVTVPGELMDEVNVSYPGFCFRELERNNMKKHEDTGLRPSSTMPISRINSAPCLPLTSSFSMPLAATISSGNHHL